MIPGSERDRDREAEYGKVERCRQFGDLFRDGMTYDSVSCFSILHTSETNCTKKDEEESV